MAFYQCGPFSEEFIKDFEKMKSQIAQLQKDVEELKQKLPTEESQSN